MKKKDIILLIYILIIIGLFAFETSRSFIETQTINHPYILGFIKTSILATSGELLASRIARGNYFTKKGLFYRFIVWGFLGMGFVLMFNVYSKGVIDSIQNNLLPQFNQTGFIINLYQAFMISLIMNLTFAPAFMLLHRVTDTYIDLGQGQISKIFRTPLSEISNQINWKNFFEFVVLKTIPFFWIPAHTITFLLPEHYRVLMAGFLSIALGLILSLAKIKGKQIE
ncbi:MAG: Mpv17/PMP22 family protein [Candidatus Izemoplasmatales bacterium]